MNAVPNFLTEIDGQTDPLRPRPLGRTPDATPLLLAHTYPGSFAEFLDMIGPLTDPVAHGGCVEDAFDVVVPSMPGFGFSTPLVGGTGRWQGGAGVRQPDAQPRLRVVRHPRQRRRRDDRSASSPCWIRPGSSARTSCSCSPSRPGIRRSSRASAPKEYAALEFAGWFASVGGYNQMNGTRPQTIAAALSDSPSASSRTTSCSRTSATAPAWSRVEQVLTQVSLYWLTNTSATRRPLPLRRGSTRAGTAW